MIFVSFGVSAFSIENLYKICKAYQANGFSFDNFSKTQVSNSLACISYLRGVKDLGSKNCRYLKISKEQGLITLPAFNVLSGYNANKENININALIASFNNYAENNTDKWEYNPTSYSEIFLSQKFPCK
jgi:hypothetical protein